MACDVQASDELVPSALFGGGACAYTKEKLRLKFNPVQSRSSAEVSYPVVSSTFMLGRESRQLSSWPVSPVCPS